MEIPFQPLYQFLFGALQLIQYLVKVKVTLVNRLVSGISLLNIKELVLMEFLALTQV